MESTMSWADAVREVHRRAAVDANFRLRCVQDSRGVLEEIAGRAFPDEHMIQFVERNDSHVQVLPPFQGAQAPLEGESLDNLAVLGPITTSNPQTC